MGFVGNYAPRGLSPQTDGMPVNRVGGENKIFPDLSHHRAYRSVHGGSTNLTSNTPLGIVIQHRD